MKQSGKIKRLLSELDTPGHEWSNAGDGWLGYETEIMLSAWSCKRRIVVLRRGTQPHMPGNIDSSHRFLIATRSLQNI